MITRAMMIYYGETREGSPNELTHLHLAFGKGFGLKEKKKKNIYFLAKGMYVCMYITYGYDKESISIFQYTHISYLLIF